MCWTLYRKTFHKPPMVVGRSLDFRLLECLVVLVAEANVTRAADRMSMSQPRMSNVLSRLRELFNDPLLVRSGHRMIPTDRALEIVAGVRTGLGHIEAAISSPDTFNPATTDKEFVFVMSDYVSLAILPALVARLTHSAPGLRIAVKGIDPPMARRWIEEGECDLAFGFFMNLGESLHASVLFHDEAVCVVSKDHPTIRHRITVDQFIQAGHAIVAGAPGPISTLEQLTDSLLAQRGMQRRILVRVLTQLTVARVVAETDLIATLPRSIAHDFARAMPLQLLPMPIRITPFDITMVWHERLHRDPAHAWLRKQCRALKLRRD